MIKIGPRELLVAGRRSGRGASLAAWRPLGNDGWRLERVPIRRVAAHRVNHRFANQSVAT
jgi:hypothetical protein